MRNASLNYSHTRKASYIGYITQSIVNSLSTLLFVRFQAEFGISLADITLLIAVNFSMQFIEDIFSAFFVDRIGYRKSVIIAHFLAFFGIFGLAFLPYFMNPMAGLVISTAVYAAGGGMIEVVVSPIIEACPTENKAASMSFLHSFFAWGIVLVVVVTTGFLSLFGAENWRIIVILWSLVPLFNAFFFMFVPINRLTERGEEMKVGKMFSSPLFWLFVIMMLSAGAAEVAMSEWASVLAELSLGIPKAEGDLLGICLFAVFMGVSRLLGSGLAGKIRLQYLMIVSGILCTFAYLLTALAPYPLLSLAGCGLCGLSVGIMWPGVYSLASSRFPRGGITMFALLALAGDFGCVAGPSVIGVFSGLADASLKTSFICGAVFPAILSAAALIYSGYVKKNSEKVSPEP